VAAIGSMELEWRINLKFLMVNLLALSCVCSDNNTYYVKPYFPQHVDCPAGYQRDSLDNYGTATNKLGLPENNTAITKDITLLIVVSTILDVL
jgi:hypothetical protein